MWELLLGASRVSLSFVYRERASMRDVRLMHAPGPARGGRDWLARTRFLTAMLRDESGAPALGGPALLAVFVDAPAAAADRVAAALPAGTAEHVAPLADAQAIADAMRAPLVAVAGVDRHGVQAVFLPRAARPPPPGAARGRRGA